MRHIRRPASRHTEADMTGACWGVVAVVAASAVPPGQDERRQRHSGVLGRPDEERLALRQHAFLRAERPECLAELRPRGP